MLLKPQMDRRTDRHTDKQTARKKTDRQSARRTNIKLFRQTEDELTDTQLGGRRHTERHTYRRTGR